MKCSLYCVTLRILRPLNNIANRLKKVRKIVFTEVWIIFGSFTILFKMMIIFLQTSSEYKVFLLVWKFKLYKVGWLWFIFILFLINNNLIIIFWWGFNFNRYIGTVDTIKFSRARQPLLQSEYTVAPIPSRVQPVVDVNQLIHNVSWLV